MCCTHISVTHIYNANIILKCIKENIEEHHCDFNVGKYFLVKTQENNVHKKHISLHDNLKAL